MNLPDGKIMESTKLRSINERETINEFIKKLPSAAFASFTIISSGLLANEKKAFDLLFSTVQFDAQFFRSPFESINLMLLSSSRDT